MNVLLLLCAILALSSCHTQLDEDYEQKVTDYDENEEWPYYRKRRSEEGKISEDDAAYNEVLEEVPIPNSFDIFFRRYKREIPHRSKRHYVVRESSGLKSHFRVNRVANRRRRDTAAATNDTDFKAKLKLAAQIQDDIQKRIGKPLELIPLEADNTTVTSENATEASNVTTTETPSSLNFTDSSNDVLVLNDFIRFKRGSEADQRARAKRRQDNQDNGDKMIMRSDSDDVDREAGSTMKEQWVKQPYPVQMPRDNNYEDNAAAASDSFRAPRVHFVTHRLSDSAQSPSVYRSFEREGRARDFGRDFRSDFGRDVPRDMDRDFSYRSSYRSDPYYRNRYEPYHQDEYRDRRYNPRYDHYDSRYYNSPDRNDHYSYSSNRQQRRIVYYATLPEVVRSPYNSDTRDRFPYDRYDDRYPSQLENYRYSRKPSYDGKSRYDSEMEGSKTPYPLKVSTDVNVREVKKNPERRIYSETERRYAYKAPAFQQEEGTYNGQQ